MAIGKYLQSVLKKEFARLQREWPDLIEYKLVFNKRFRSTFGQCRYGPKEIHIAQWLLDSGNEPKCIDTLRHECAHAVARSKAGDGGHGKGWKKYAKLLGAEPTRCGSYKIWANHSPSGQAGYRYKATCENPDCDAVWKRKRRTKWWNDPFVTCTRCGSGLNFEKLK